MRKTRLSFAISAQIAEEIAIYVGEDKDKSQFIEQALKNELDRLKHEKLIEAYSESALETYNENRFFEGVTGDGIS